MSFLKKKSREIRDEILDIFELGTRGHVPSAFSMVEILVTLYYQKAKITPSSIKDNDKILLSKGHGCLALYAILKDLDFIKKEEYEKFCKVDGILGGHPTKGKVPGVEISAGSLGHGLSIAIGKAIALKKKKMKQHIYVILGDGECNEGSIWEATLSANKNQLNNLTILIDYNKLQSYGPTEEVCPLEPFSDKWTAFGLDCLEVDMKNSPEKLLEILNTPTSKTRVIICHTIKGLGNSILETDISWHHKSKVTPQEVDKLREAQL
jgi:transketolase